MKKLTILCLFCAACTPPKKFQAQAILKDKCTDVPLVSFPGGKIVDAQKSVTPEQDKKLSLTAPNDTEEVSLPALQDSQEIPKDGSCVADAYVKVLMVSGAKADMDSAVQPLAEEYNPGGLATLHGISTLCETGARAPNAKGKKVKACCAEAGLGIGNFFSSVKGAVKNYAKNSGATKAGKNIKQLVTGKQTKSITHTEIMPQGVKLTTYDPTRGEMTSKITTFSVTTKINGKTAEITFSPTGKVLLNGKKISASRAQRILGKDGMESLRAEIATRKKELGGDELNFRQTDFNYSHAMMQELTRRESAIANDSGISQHLRKKDLDAIAKEKRELSALSEVNITRDYMKHLDAVDGKLQQMQSANIIQRNPIVAIEAIVVASLVIGLAVGLTQGGGSNNDGGGTGAPASTTGETAGNTGDSTESESTGDNTDDPGLDKYDDLKIEPRITLTDAEGNPQSAPMQFVTAGRGVSTDVSGLESCPAQ